MVLRFCDLNENCGTIGCGAGGGIKEMKMMKRRA